MEEVVGSIPTRSTKDFPFSSLSYPPFSAVLPLAQDSAFASLEQVTFGNCPLHVGGCSSTS